MENKNQPAFPKIDKIRTQIYTDRQGEGGNFHPVESSGGLTKREYFAAMAMQAFIHKCAPVENEKNEPKPNYELIASCSVSMVDCILKELEK